MIFILDSIVNTIFSSFFHQVCEEQSCEDQVFLVAIQLMDRFLSSMCVQKTQLQLVACVSLLLASKLRQCNYLSAELLSYYTDNSVTVPEITVSSTYQLWSNFSWYVSTQCTVREFHCFYALFSLNKILFFYPSQQDHSVSTFCITIHNFKTFYP